MPPADALPPSTRNIPDDASSAPPTPHFGGDATLERASETGGDASSGPTPQTGDDGRRARLLAPNDDVATALADLARGTRGRVALGATAHDVKHVDPVKLRHYFAVRALAAGARVR
jgi:hypothetical protein